MPGLMYATESLTIMVLILVESLGGQHATPNLVPYLLVYSPYVIIPAVVGWRCAGDGPMWPTPPAASTAAAAAAARKQQ